MRVYPFSIIIVLILLVLLIRDWHRGIKQYFKHVFYLYVSVVLFSNIGNFIEIGSFTLTNRAFLSVFTFLIAALVIVFDKGYDVKIMFAGIGLYLSVVIGYFMLVVFPYKYGVIRLLSQWDGYVAGNIGLDYLTSISFDFEAIFKIVHFPIVLAVAYRVLAERQEKRHFLELLLRISNFVLLFSIAEMIVVKVFSIPINAHVLRPIFGESEATFVYTNRLQGLFKEASHYASALFIWGLLNIFEICSLRKSGKTAKRSKDTIRFILIMILLVASTSFVGLFYFGLLLVAYLFYCTRLNNVGIVACLGVIGIPLLFIVTNASFMGAIGLDSLYQRIDRAIETINRLFHGEVGTVSSEGARFTSIFSMLQILIKRPLFGVGAGITDAHSTLFATLGNLGLIGTGFLAYIYIRFGRVSNHKLSLYVIVCLYLSFAGSFGAAFDFQYPLMFLFAGYAFEKEKEICAEQDRQMVCEKLLV